MTTEIVGIFGFKNKNLFEVVVNDILKEPVDCIVNAANGNLAHGGGVALAIAREAGEALENEGKRYIEENGPVPVGKAVMTTAGNLPFKGVIHAVGPVFGHGSESDLIKSALLESFRIANENSFSSLSFPAISSGIFAVPAKICVESYLAAVGEFFGSKPGAELKRIRLCLFPGKVLDLIRRNFS